MLGILPLRMQGDMQHNFRLHLKCGSFRYMNNYTLYFCRISPSLSALDKGVTELHLGDHLTPRSMLKLLRQ